MKIRVFIADDHALVRKGLRQVLEESDHIEVVGEAADYTGLAACASCSRTTTGSPARSPWIRGSTC